MKKIIAHNGLWKREKWAKTARIRTFSTFFKMLIIRAWVRWHILSKKISIENTKHSPRHLWKASKKLENWHPCLMGRGCCTGTFFDTNISNRKRCTYPKRCFKTPLKVRNVKFVVSWQYNSPYFLQTVKSIYYFGHYSTFIKHYLKFHFLLQL